MYIRLIVPGARRRNCSAVAATPADLIQVEGDTPASILAALREFAPEATLLYTTEFTSARTSPRLPPDLP